MKLNYCHVAGGNFGDDLNTWLWGNFFEDRLFNREDGCSFFGIGTLLSTSNLAGRDKMVVLGSGAGQKCVKYDREKCEFFWVRGPKTASALGLSPGLSIADPAYLLLESPLRELEEKCYKVSIIPHHKSISLLDWSAVSKRCGFNYIDPRCDFQQVIEQIKQSEIVVCESLHGAIVADAFDVPWVAVSYGYRFNHMKWQDWAESMQLTLKVHDLPCAVTGKVKWTTGWKNYIRSKIGKAINNPAWSKRPYRTTGSAELQALEECLLSLAIPEKTSLSDRDVVKGKVNAMMGKIDEFKAQYL